MGVAWSEATDLPATFTDTPRKSAFYIWICCALGHIAGLLKEQGTGEGGAQDAVLVARQRKLLPIPSARTLKAAFEAMEKRRRAV